MQLSKRLDFRQAEKEVTLDYSKEELEEAQRSIASTLSKCEKVLPKLAEGSPQHTLTVRRIKAFNLALALIERELDGSIDE